MDLETLYAGAIDGRTEDIAVLEKKADRLDKDGRTILHTESMYENTERVRFILMKFAHKNLLVKLDAFQQTALHLAADRGYSEVVEALIYAARRLVNVDPHNPVSSFEAFVRQPDNKLNTALHLAVSNDHMDVARRLVAADRDDRHIKNLSDETPMYLAAKREYYDIVKLICEVCRAPSLDGPHGTTALHPVIMKLHQAKHRDRDVASKLIDAARRSACSEDAPYNSFEALFNITDENGYNVLQLAVQVNNPDAVRLILAEDPAYKNGRWSKNSDLKSLIYFAAEKRFNNIVKLLCEPYEDGKEPGGRGQTSLQAAIIGRDIESVFRLLEYDQTLVLYQDLRGWTPLHYAAYYKFDSVLDIIVEKRRSAGYLAFTEPNIATPLVVAVREGHTSTVMEFLKILPLSLSEGVDSDDQNILHIMASQSNKEMIRSILRFPLSCTFLNGQDTDGNTPLHILARQGCYVPEFIKDDRVDKTIRNLDYRTPLEMIYFNEKISDDQVRIKIAIDNTQTNQRWKFWQKSIKANLNETELPPWSKKEEEFIEAKKLVTEEEIKRKKDNFKLVKDDLERYRQRTNTQIIVTALITTVTFTVGFTMPGGYHQSGEPGQGQVLLSKETAFKAFMVSDALALVLSTSSLFLYFIASMYDDPRQVSKLNAASTVLNIVSVIGMMLTFVTGTYVVLSHSPALAITVCLICCLFFILVIFQLIKWIYDRRLEKIHMV